MSLKTLRRPLKTLRRLLMTLRRPLKTLRRLLMTLRRLLMTLRRLLMTLWRLLKPKVFAILYLTNGVISSFYLELSDNLMTLKSFGKYSCPYLFFGFRFSVSAPRFQVSQKSSKSSLRAFFGVVTPFIGEDFWTRKSSNENDSLQKSSLCERRNFEIGVLSPTFLTVILGKGDKGENHSQNSETVRKKNEQ